MEMNVEKDEGNEILKAIIRSRDCYRPKTTGECGVVSAIWVA
jgi:hypothetical protein